MPRKKPAPQPSSRPHTVPRGSSQSRSRAQKDISKDIADSNSTQQGSNSNSDELAVTLASHDPRSSPKTRGKSPIQVDTRSSHTESNNEENTQKYSPPSKKPLADRRHTFSAPTRTAKDFEPTKVYSKTLQNLGRPMSRVATAFIADIVGTPYEGNKRRSSVKFTDEHKDFDVLDVNEPDDDSSQLGDDDDYGLLGVTGAAALPKLIAKSIRHGYQDEEPAKKISEDEESGSEIDSTSNSDAEPPSDPTAHVGIKIKHRLPTPYYPRPTDPSAPIRRSIQKKKEPVPKGPVQDASAFVRKNQLVVQNLPIQTTIDDLKKVFLKATSIKLILTRDRYEQYKRSATIDFASTTHAKSSYNKAKNSRIGGSIIEFAPIKVKDSNANRDNESDDSDSEETIEDYLPQEQMDKDAMVREWIKIQSRYATKSKTFMKKYKL